MRALIILSCLLASACSNDAEPPLIATDLAIMAPLPGQNMSAGYLTLRNNTDDAIHITAVTSLEFGAVEMHESITEDGVAKMRRLPDVLIPGKSTVQFKRGGKHLMLMRRQETTEFVSLNFYTDEVLLLNVQAPVIERNN